jgi:hypothetical protein
MGTREATPKVYARTFQKAAELAGGLRNLAHELHVPLAIFLRAVDYVLDETAPPGGLSDTN